MADVMESPATPPTSLADAEAHFLARRSCAPAVVEAAEAAMICALGDAALASPTLLPAAREAAAAVEAHGAGFAPGAEPAYHNRYHQAEAALAMGWLCGAARRAGLLTPEEASLGVLAMIGHDLLHDGNEGGPPGRLEARSADLAASMARARGIAPAAADLVRDLILSTDISRPPGPGLLHALAREADQLGSLTPVLGWRLSHALAAERRAAGRPDWAMVASFAGRLAFLNMLAAATPVGAAFGLDRARQSQIAAFALAPGLPGATPGDGAAALDALPRAEACPRYHAAVASLGEAT